MCFNILGMTAKFLLGGLKDELLDEWAWGRGCIEDTHARTTYLQHQITK